jgi:translation initiation factor IF-3
MSSPDGSCTINATFNPTSSSGKKSAPISISSNDPKNPTINVKLSGQAAPKIAVEGTWGVQGKMKVKVSLQGRSQAVSDTVPDQFTFSNDGSFEMSDMDGTWSQQGSNFIVNLDPDSISSYFADNLSEELGLDVSIDVTNMSFTGKVQKNGTIKGSFKINVNFDIEDYDLHGTVAASANYTGKRIETSSASSGKEQERSQLTESILHMIKEELNNALQGL